MRSLLIPLAGCVTIALISGTVLIVKRDSPAAAGICRLVFAFFFCLAGILVTVGGIRVRQLLITVLGLLLVFVSAKQLFSGMRR